MPLSFSAHLPIVVAAVLAFTTTVWIVSLVLRDASIMDIAWGPGFVLAGATLFALSGAGTARGWVVLAFTAAWGLRLAGHIFVRSLGQGEDPRYARWRREAGASWWWRSWLKVFLLQGVILCVVALPILVQVAAPTDVGVTPWDVAGGLLWLTGFVVESVADLQLLRFRRSTDSGGVLDRGLWRYSRHPNYFGETLVWWGFGLMALSVSGGWIALVGPLLITWLILKVSGVTMLERHQAETRPGYAEYVWRTPAFVPWKPKAEPDRQDS